MSSTDQARDIALSRLRAAERRFREAQEEQRRAIFEAAAADLPLRTIAENIGRSHEWVRRLLAADGQVVVETGDEAFTLSGRQVEMLIYKLGGTARGEFPGDVELLGDGDAWLPDAGALASDLQRAMADEEGQPVTLDKKRKVALYQILRLTFFDGRSNLARLFDALGEQLGMPRPHVIANMRVRNL